MIDVWQESAASNRSVTQSGNTYKITGTVSHVGANRQMNVVPYEIDVTCS